MPEGVKIPVSVSGAEAATEKLRAVGVAAGEARQAGQQAAPAQAAGGGGLGQLAAAAGAAAEGQRAFARETRVMAAHLLAQLNPALGSTFVLLTQIVTGVHGMNTALLGLVGVTAVVGAIGAAFAALRRQAEEAAAAIQRMHEAAERGERARAEQRGRGAERRARLAETGRVLGLAGEAAPWQREIDALARERGVPTELGEQAVMAESLARAQGIPFDRERYLAGLISGGPRLAGPTAEAAAGIRANLARGGTPTARAFAAAYLADVAPAAQLRAPSREEARAAELDRVMAELARERPELGEREITLARRFAQMGGIPIEEPRFAEPPAITREEWARVGGPAEALERARAEWIEYDIRRRLPGLKHELEGTTLSATALAELANEIVAALREREGEDWQRNAWQPPPPSAGQPVQITINQYNTPTTNVSSLYTVQPGAREQARAQELGVGEWINE